MTKLRVSYNGTPAEAEINLEKAVTTLQVLREGQVFRDKSLRELREHTDSIRQKVVAKMLEEIVKVVTE